MNVSNKDNIVNKMFSDIIYEWYPETDCEVMSPFMEAKRREMFHHISCAKEEWFKIQLKKSLHLAMNADLLGDAVINLRKKNKEMALKGAILGADERNQLFLWLTISPHKNIKLEDFLNQLHKYANRSMFSAYMYVLEQRSKFKNSAGDGFHAHLLLKRTMKYKPSKVKSNSQNTWKNFTNVYNEKIFNFNWCPREYLEDKKKYMSSGGKLAEGKDKKQAIDIFWRKKYDIKPWYESEMQME